ncbi:SDR family oxidoreductase [Streptomyces sp. MMS24-I2-30]|uniref:SDR family oxidoreductase n=1 Tax=Streptomyces sp. MMS24-I2-30 TaxID=3351564 RepID=UPI003896E3B2
MSGRPDVPAARDLSGKIALVTGGGKGAGAAISRELARHGALVVVNSFHSPRAADETVAAIRSAGGRAEALRASVAKRDQVTAMFAALAERHGGVDIVVNNAARGVFARFDDLTDTEWQRALDTNVHGARWCALEAAPLMAARGGGAIVNVSSIGAGLAMDNYLLVGVCKAALEAMTRYLAADLGPLGIRVNTASAGLLDNATAGLFPDADALRATCAAAAPLGGVGHEDDLSQLVSFLASPQARWISGQCLLADGGLSVGRAMLTPRRPAPPTAPAENPPADPPHTAPAPLPATATAKVPAPGDPAPAAVRPATSAEAPALGSPGGPAALSTPAAVSAPPAVSAPRPAPSAAPAPVGRRGTAAAAAGRDGDGTKRATPRTAAKVSGDGRRTTARTVAVVGMGLVAPGAEGPEALRQRLMEGVPQFSEPGERFPLEHFWSSEDVVDRTYSRVAGYVRPAPDTPSDTASDTAEDFLTAWTRTALLQCDAPRLASGAGVRTACFTGAWAEGSQHVEESLLVETAADGIAEHWDPGATEDPEALRALLVRWLRSVHPYAGTPARHLPPAALRAAVASLLPAPAPVQVVDTACSSSLYAIDLGARALLDGELDLALCGGVFSLGARYSVLFSQLRGLSRSGAVRAFDARADGVLFADGAAFVALKRLDAARADGDHVLGVLAGFGAASDGRGRAVHAPNATGQQRALARARAVSGVSPEQIDWVIAHVTGTPVGDRVERGVLSEQLPHAWCTSNKSVFGHTGWAAGAVSVVHALQGMAHSTIPPQIPYRCPDDAPPLRVPTEPVPWPRPADRPRTVGVSAFGFGGTNGHLLLQDAPRPGEAAPASLPATVDDDPVVVVAWSAHLPETPDVADVARRLADGRAPAARRSFGARYPLPSFAEVPLPARTAAAVDRAQLMALQAVAALVPPNASPWWEGLRETCGVFAAHTGVPAVSPDLTVRCHAASLAEAATRPAPSGLDRAELRRATAAFLDAVRERTGCGEDTLAGLMPNVIPARVAALHDLHGPTMTLDTGLTSGRSALRAAAAHLRRGELELALVLGANGAAGPLSARLHDIGESREPAEGAFALVLTRASVARARGWPQLAGLGALLDRLPAEHREPDGWSYLGADDLIAVLRHLVTRVPVPASAAAAPTTTPTRPEPTYPRPTVTDPTSTDPTTLDPASTDPASAFPAPPDPTVTDPAHPAEGTAVAVTWRHTLSWEAAGPCGTGARPLPARTLVVTDSRYASDLRALVDAGDHCRLVAVDGDQDPQEAVDRVLRVSPEGFRHLRVVADLHSAPAWPAPPTAGVLAVQEAAFWAVRRLRDRITTGGTVAVGVTAPYLGAEAAPHAHLFTGFVKSLAWELSGCTVRAVVGDSTRPRTVLAALEDELARPADGLPVVRHRGATRFVQRITENIPATADGPLPLAPGAVVVATGGARGITAACLLGLARHVPLRVHLVGSSRPADLPDGLLHAPDQELPAARARYITDQRSRTPQRPVGEISAAFDRLLHARESALTLRALGESCGAGQVHFHTCDVTDANAVQALADAVRAREGHVDLLVNGAGLHHPGDITRKTLPGMRRIRDVKLLGHHHLRATFTGALTPRLWCNFGSVTGIAGLPGESDYSPANDFLSAAAHVGADGEFTIAWTIWDETGLGSGAIVQAHTARTARLSRMTTAEGVTHFLTELRRRAPGESGEGGNDRLVTFIGDAEHRSFDTLFPGLRTTGNPGRISPAAPAHPSRATDDDVPSRPPAAPVPAPPGREPVPVPSPGGATPAGLLDGPVTRRADHATWDLVLDLDAHGFLRDHLVDGRPTVPGVLLADIAVQAARTLAPGLPPRAVDDLAFSAWVRARSDGRPARYRVAARRRGSRTACAVSVTIRSDVVAPDGRVLSRDREHFRATVRLGGPVPLPEPYGPLTGAHRTVDDPYYDAASPVLLTGAFRATDQCRTTGTGTTARWRPGPPQLSALPRLSTPAVLLDGLARTPALQPTPDGHHTVAVPHHIERITLYEHGDDHDLVRTHPAGLRLHHSPATATSTASTQDGRVIAQISGLRATVLAHVPARSRTPTTQETPASAGDHDQAVGT